MRTNSEQPPLDGIREFVQKTNFEVEKKIYLERKKNRNVDWEKVDFRKLFIG